MKYNIRLLAAGLAAVLLTEAFIPQAGTAKAAGIELKNPRIVSDSSMESGQKVTWDCVWFGSYPQAEVVTEEMRRNYTALDSSLLRDGDLFVSDDVYSALESASEWDVNNDITLGGEKYRRMRKGDATYANTGSGYYKWLDSTSWHYYKYEPVKWRVLETDGNQALLLSDIVLDNQKYHIGSEDVTWETCTVRSWLNGYGAGSNQQGIDYSGKNFLNSAFSAAEQDAIRNSALENADNLYYGTEGGNGTTDKVFFLAESDVWNTDKATAHGFVKDYNTEDEARQSKSSTYAKAMGTYSHIDGAYADNCVWRLRSPGLDGSFAACVDCDGWVSDYGAIVDGRFGVRAALNLNLSSSNLYTYAGTVSSDGTMEEVGKQPSREKEALDKAITDAEAATAGKTEADYKSGWSKYKSALEAAKELKAKAESGALEATAEEMSRAAEELNEKVAALQEKTAEEKEAEEKAKEELNAALDAAEKMLNEGQGSYSDETWQAFREAYENAKNYGDGMTEESLKDMLEKLTAAQEGLAEEKSPENKDEETERYTVSYDANGGSGAPPPQVKMYREELVLSDVKPLREGYTFLGWASFPDAVKVEFQAGGAYQWERSINLYAVWLLEDPVLPSQQPGSGTQNPQSSAQSAFEGQTPSISVKTAGAKKIKVSWKKVSGAQKYYVYYATSPSGSYKLAKTLASSSTSCTISKLKKDSVYYFKVRGGAVEKGRTVYTKYSSIASKKAVGAPPKPPLKGKISGSNLVLQWKKQKDVKKVAVYRKVNGGAYKIIKTLNGKKKSYKISLKSYEKTNRYFFCVKSCYIKGGVKIWSGSSKTIKILPSE